MKPSNVLAVTMREYLSRVKKKSFIISTLIVPVLLFCALYIPFSLLDKGEYEGTSSIMMPESGQKYGQGLSESDREALSDILGDLESQGIVSLQDEKTSPTPVHAWVSLSLGMLIFTFITLFSTQVMNSVAEEKRSKTVEVLLSSISSDDILFGKIFGTGLVGLTQFLLWTLLSGGIFAIVALFSGSGMTAAADLSAVLSGMDLSSLLLYFFIFFILGYLLYASVFAVIGSIGDGSSDNAQVRLLATIPLFIGSFLAIHACNNPESTAALWGSVIPFTSPMVMLARLPYGVPGWQISMSLALMVITFLLIAWLSARIYRKQALSTSLIKFTVCKKGN